MTVTCLTKVAQGRCAVITVALLLVLLADPIWGTEDQVGKDISIPISVTFVTLRNKTDDAAPDNHFGGTRDRLRTGTSTIAFSPLWGLDQIAETAPFYIPTEKQQITAIEEMPEQQFWDDISAFAARNDGNVVLYIHGYKIGFEKSCHRAAIFQRALDLHDRLVLFSWPADGTLIKYNWDVSDMLWSVPYLEYILEGLVKRLGKGRVDVVAHSLGARGVVLALSRLSLRQTPDLLLNELVLLAPDIDTDNFSHVLPEIRPLVKQITVYASEYDKALMASRELNGYPRLGQAGEDLTVFKDVQMIDISPTGMRRFSGHIYHLYNPAVVKDLTQLLNTGKPADQRPALQAMTWNSLPYWRLMPDPENE